MRLLRATFALFFVPVETTARSAEPAGLHQGSERHGPQELAATREPGTPEQPDISAVPGTVIAHSPKSTGLYLGSPSIAILPNGHYVVSHDVFGPNSNEFAAARTVIFTSTDRGGTWRRLSEIQGAFWSSLFVHRGVVYLLGTNTHHGVVLIRASRDGGITWTVPAGSSSGLLRDDGQYHCAPVPVIQHAGRFWRAFERRDPPRGWAITYQAGVLSAPIDANLLDAKSWTFSEPVAGKRDWLDGGFGGWLEGNAVIGRDGRVYNLLRVVSDFPERAALVQVSADGRKTTFDPKTGFVLFPGGAKKFTVRPDPNGGGFWSLANVALPIHRSAGRPGGIRNAVALTASVDLRKWEIRSVLLYHPEVRVHGFQYVDWQFEGDDIIAVSRTAYDDEWGGAANFHDSNFITFHRVRNFRALQLRDSVCDVVQLGLEPVTVAP